MSHGAFDLRYFDRPFAFAQRPPRERQYNKNEIVTRFFFLQMARYLRNMEEV